MSLVNRAKNCPVSLNFVLNEDYLFPGDRLANTSQKPMGTNGVSLQMQPLVFPIIEEDSETRILQEFYKNSRNSCLALDSRRNLFLERFI